MIEIDVPYQSMIIDNRKSSDMRKKTIHRFTVREFACMRCDLCRPVDVAVSGSSVEHN